MKVEGQNAYPHSELTGRIIKACQAVHRFLGPGFPEVVYHRSVLMELSTEGLKWSSQPEIAVHYRNGSLVGTFEPDILVEGLVVVELKALANLTDEHVSQALTYLKATNLQVALLVNFGEPSLKVRRLINSHHDPQRPSNLGQSRR